MTLTQADVLNTISLKSLTGTAPFIPRTSNPDAAWRRYLQNHIRTLRKVKSAHRAIRKDPTMPVQMRNDARTAERTLFILIKALHDSRGSLNYRITWTPPDSKPRASGSEAAQANRKCGTTKENHDTYVAISRNRLIHPLLRLRAADQITPPRTPQRT